jgi:hypothetical protein
VQDAFAVTLTSVRFQLKSVVDLGRIQTYPCFKHCGEWCKRAEGDGALGGGLVGGVALNLRGRDFGLKQHLRELEFVDEPVP